MQLEKSDLEKAIEIALHFQHDRSQCGISNHKVGACLVAENDLGQKAYFGGCNIEFSTSFNIHAERVSLVKAISAGFKNLKGIVVTSKEKATATMCGYCRQDYLYVKPDIIIYVINPDGTIGIQEKLIDTMSHAYTGRSKIV